ncbi:MAG: hypothetical protein WCT31_02405, partial [Candidatus Micrarchaeia archaeon]
EGGLWGILGMIEMSGRFGQIRTGNPSTNSYEIRRSLFAALKGRTFVAYSDELREDDPAGIVIVD